MTSHSNVLFDQGQAVCFVISKILLYVGVFRSQPGDYAPGAVRFLIDCACTRVHRSYRQEMVCTLIQQKGEGSS